MIVDASALLAILLDEPEAATLAEALDTVPTSYMSAVNFLEIAVKIDGLGNIAGVQKFEALLDLAGVEVQPVTLAQTKLARIAYATYGRGRHAAGLNLGDCFAYALAKETGMPLLFKGNDFPLTDISSAVAA